MFADNPQLDAQVPAACAHRPGERHLQHAVDVIQHVRVRGDDVYRRHSLPKRTGIQTAHVTLFVIVRKMPLIQCKIYMQICVRFVFKIICMYKNISRRFFSKL